MLLQIVFAEGIFTALSPTMKLTNKYLGAIGMVAAPFLFLQMIAGNDGNDYNTSLGGFFDLIYMFGWMCSIVGLHRLKFINSRRCADVLFQVQLGFLFLANIWNAWVIFDPANKSNLFFVLDMCWPLSNLCLLAIGIPIAINGKISHWKRYIVLIAGLWLPVAFSFIMIFGRNNFSLIVGGVYSTIAWFLLGWMVFTSVPLEEKEISFAGRPQQLSKNNR
jgi:hypothetical protein